MEKVRLHKWMASQGIASRRAAERLIKLGQVEVNGVVETTMGRQIDPSKDKVKFRGKLLSAAPPSSVYWLLNKPDATLTTKSDPEGRATVFHLPSLERIPFPVISVGRLDYKTEGLLLLSNDGELAHRLMHPSFHMPRTYDVLLPKKLTDTQLKRFAEGIRLEDGPTAAIDIRPVGAKNMGKSHCYWYRLIVHEGRNRLVRRIFEKLGARIVKLVRVAYGPIRLPPDLPPGEIMPLSADQILRLKQLVGLAPIPEPARRTPQKRTPSRAKPNPSENLRTPEATPVAAQTP